MNESTSTFSRGSDDRSIRVGFLRVDGIGPGAAGELVRNQPFSSIEDIRERTSSRSVKVPTIEALRALGALRSLGIDGDDDDVTQLNLLGMVLNKPRAFKGVKVAVPRRNNGNWRYLGLQRNLDLTFGKVFCSKLFWIPYGSPLALKTNSSGHYSAYLLPAVDENGVVFDLQVGENKDAESRLIKILAEQPSEDGAPLVVCLDGQVGLPFLRGGNTTFKVWGVTGARNANPQVWGIDEEVAKEIIKLENLKSEMRRSG